MYGSTIEDGEQLRAKEILINYLSLKEVLGERERQCCDIDVVYPKQSCCIFNFALHIYISIGSCSFTVVWFASTPYYLRLPI